MTEPIMSITFNKKSIIKYVAGMIFLIFTISAAILWIIAGQIVSPDRRSIQDYHRDWINHPAAHGIRIDTGQCDKGRAPCLFVAPDPTLTPGKRGDTLRKQLVSEGIPLKPYGQTTGILLLLHGRNGRKEDLLPVAERFAAAGFKCVMPDLPAHGDSPIAQVFFSTTRFEQDIADNVLNDARDFFADKNSPAGIWGLSMGGAFAINEVARSPSHWKAVVIVSSFDSLDGVVQDKLSALPYPLSKFIGHVFSTMVRYRSGLDLSEVQPAIWAKSITIPVLMAHGDVDPLISPNRGRNLFNAIQSQNKQWVNVPGGNHNNILVTDMPLYAVMSAWFITHTKT